MDSIKELLEEHVKQTYSKITEEFISDLSDTLKLDKEKLIYAWNKVNPDFKVEEVLILNNDR